MKKILLLLILYCSLLSVNGFAQSQHKIDSLHNELKKFGAHKKRLGSKFPAMFDSTKADILYEISKEYKGSNPDTAMFYTQQVLSLSEQTGYKKGIGNAYNGMGGINYFKGDNMLALEYFQKSLKIYEEIGYRKGIGNAYNGIGSVYYTICNLPEALKNHLNALKIRKEIGDKQGIAYSFNNIGLIYSGQGNYPEALINLLTALKMMEELGDKKGIEICYLKIGDIYYVQTNFPEALKNYRASLKISEEIGNKQGIADSYYSIGNIYYGQGNFQEAVKNILIGLKKYQEIGLKDGISNAYYCLGTIYLDQGNYSESLKNCFIALKMCEQLLNKDGIANLYILMGHVYEKQGNLKEALKYESKGLSLALEVGDKDHLKRAYANLANINAKLNNYKAAYENEVLYKQYYDSIYSKENEKKLTSLQMQYEFDKKEQADSILHASENKINSLKLHKQKEYTGLGIVGFALVVLLLFFVYRNYTNQRKATAEMAIARQRAEQSEKFKEQFLANMSHEIRTPMNAVIGMTNLVMDSPLNENQKFYLEGIRKSGETLLIIINDILDLSKIEAGKMEMENIDFSVSDVLEQVKQTLQHKAEERGLQLIVDKDGNIPDVLIGDPVRLNQILMNLAGNAIKFTEKGSVTIEVKKGTSGSGIKFSIHDTGIGIPEDKLQSIFESFSQAKASDTRRYGGTGLGLTISKQLVELMEGKISVESKEGLGTTFSFEINFPVGSSERLKEQRSAEQIDGSILDGLKILLADDNEYNRIVTHDTLKSKARVEITEATNGKEVIEKLGQQDFDVVLMDVQMPVMDGYEATRYIREKFAPPKNQTKVIALTASVIRSDLDKCRDAGMNDYISKPFKVSQLISVIAKASGREIRFSEKKISEMKNETEYKRRITDLAYLEKFCEGDKERMKKYIDMFLASAPSLIDNINVALNNKDSLEIASQVHGNKTKLIMMGMNATIDLGVEIEKHCRQENNTDSVKLKLQQLVQQIETAITELKAI